MGDSLIKLMLVDDQILLVKSLKRVIESISDDMEIIATAYDGKEALELLKSVQPDIILLDVRMPGMDGVETARIVSSMYPKVQIVMLTTFDDDDYIKEALKYGVVGYILKDIEPLDLISCIRAIYSGSVLISPLIAAKLFKQIQYFERKEDNITDTSGDSIPLWMKALSPRERDVLKLIAKGLTNRQIADKLFIAEQTVRNHVSLIYSKLGVHNRITTMQMVLEANLNK